LLENHGDRFKKKSFSPKEIIYCDGKSNPSIHYAGRFAAKEAVKKCFYSSELTNQISFSNIEILPKDNRAPVVSSILNYKYYQIIVIFYDESEYAVAMAMLVV